MVIEGLLLKLDRTVENNSNFPMFALTRDWVMKKVPYWWVFTLIGFHELSINFLKEGLELLFASFEARGLSTNDV